MRADIVVIGSLNMDMVVSVSRTPKRGETLMGSGFFMSAGGKGANQAYAAGRLGASVAMVGRVGQDLFADQLLAQLQQAGVDTSCTWKVKDESTGVALINIDQEGDNSIIVAPGANMRLTAEAVREHEAVIAGAKLVMIQLEIPMEAVQEAVDIAHKYGVDVMLDPAPAPDAPLTEELLRKVQYIVPNEHEITTLTQMQVGDVETAYQAGADLLGKGVGTVFAKLGGKGGVVISKDVRFAYSAYPVEVKDTTAAGDAFAGALAAAIVGGQNLRNAVSYAAAAGALTVTRIGAQSAVPDFNEVRQFMSDQQDPLEMT